ncbi:MAG: hypothetical protein H7270_04055 [Dermatophilaceae bacterium]|nr:hypothetical protein [Dermatophilaceae bacterium]
MRSVIKAFALDLDVSSVGTVGQAPPPPEQGMGSGKPAPGSKLDFLAARPPGCSVPAVFGSLGTVGDMPVDQRCVLLGSGVQEQHAQIQVISLTTLAVSTPLSEAERRTLGGGGMLVFDPKMMRGGFVELVSGRAKAGTPEKPAATPVVTGHQRVPAAVIDRHTWEPALAGGQPGAWVLPATAARLDWPVTPNFLEVTSPTGMISATAESAVNDRRGDENWMQVERGFKNDAWLILLMPVLGRRVSRAGPRATSRRARSPRLSPRRSRWRSPRTTWRLWPRWERPGIPDLALPPRRPS